MFYAISGITIRAKEEAAGHYPNRRLACCRFPGLAVSRRVSRVLPQQHAWAGFEYAVTPKQGFRTRAANRSLPSTEPAGSWSMQDKHKLSPEQGRTGPCVPRHGIHTAIRQAFRLTLTVRGRVVGPDSEALLVLMKRVPGQLLSKTTLAGASSLLSTQRDPCQLGGDAEPQRKPRPEAVPLLT